MRIKIPDDKVHPVVAGDFLTRYYHLPFVRFFFLSRLKAGLKFMKNMKFKNLLEIGIGSGVFLEELKRRCDNLFGIDISPDIISVKSMIENAGIEANLAFANAMNLPYKDSSFDCVVSMSVLEHIIQLEQSISEIRRVLTRNGVAILGFPVGNKITRLLLLLMRAEKEHKKRLEDLHCNTHRDILRMVNKYFNANTSIKKIPLFLPLDFSLYCVCSSIKR